MGAWVAPWNARCDACGEAHLIPVQAAAPTPQQGPNDCRFYDNDASLHPCQHCIFFIIHLDRQVLVCLQEAKEQDEGAVGETIGEFFIIFPLHVNMG